MLASNTDFLSTQCKGYPDRFESWTVRKVRSVTPQTRVRFYARKRCHLLQFLSNKTRSRLRRQNSVHAKCRDGGKIHGRQAKYYDFQMKNKRRKEKLQFLIERDIDFE